MGPSLRRSSQDSSAQGPRPEFPSLRLAPGPPPSGRLEKTVRRRGRQTVSGRRHGGRSRRGRGGETPQAPQSCSHIGVDDQSPWQRLPTTQPVEGRPRGFWNRTKGPLSSSSPPFHRKAKQNRTKVAEAWRSPGAAQGQTLQDDGSRIRPITCLFSAFSVRRHL